MNAISPGVYARIIPLGSYVQQVPGDYAFMAFVSDKGPDNQLIFVSGQEDSFKTFGKTNFNKYGAWAQGKFVFDNYLTAASSAYAIRVLPMDATFSNMAYFITKLKDLHVSSTNLDIYHPLEGKYTSIKELKSSANFDDLLGTLSDNTATQTSITVPDYMDLVPDVGFESNGQHYVLRVQEVNGTPQLVSRKVTDGPLSSIYAVDSTNKLYEFNFTTMKFDLVDPVVTVDPQTDVVPLCYIKDDSGNKLYKISVGTNGDVVLDEISTWNLSDLYDVIKPLYVIYGNGRGDYYNNYRVSFDVPVNADYTEIEIDLNIDGSYYTQIRLPAGFIPGQLDDTSSSVFISDTLGTYFEDLQIYLKEEDMPLINSEIKDLIFKTDSFGNPVVSNVLRVDYIQQIPPDNPEEDKVYFITHNATGDWFAKDGYTATWNGSEWIFSTESVENSEIILTGDEAYIHIGFGKVLSFNAYTYVATDLQYVKLDLDEGSDGSIMDSNGQVNATIVTQLLTQAYQGMIDPSVTNVDNYWFDLILDAGYPKPVKDAIVSLSSEIRKDCMSLIDLGDAKTEDQAYENRVKEYYYDTFFAAIYEPFVEVYDSISARYKWVTPIYEVAKLVAINDRDNYQWYAVAGEERGAVTDVNDLRFNPNHSERDIFYLNQINPFVKFKDSPVMLYGQLTAERTPHSTNNINVVRTTLYIQRALKQYCRRKEFDFNDPITYHQMENDIKLFLKQIKDERGLEYYSVKVTASDYEKKIKAARVSVRFKVTGIIEKFFLDLYVE